MNLPSQAVRIRRAGLRCTPGRTVVLEMIEAMREPVTHAQLLAQSSLQHMDSVTLYRTLDALHRAGLLHRIQGEKGIWRYCPQPRHREGCPGNHAHFLCVRCGAMRCLVEQPLPRIEVPPNVTVFSREFIAHGICETCSADSGDISR